MKSIKEYNTSGLSISEREDLYTKVTPIPVGEIVYKAGDAWDYTELVKVTEENQKWVTMYWNSIYFDNANDADEITNIAHAAYGDYQAAAAEGWW